VKTTLISLPYTASHCVKNIFTSGQVQHRSTDYIETFIEHDKRLHSGWQGKKVSATCSEPKPSKGLCEQKFISGLKCHNTIIHAEVRNLDFKISSKSWAKLTMTVSL
jgi:hypothetical protein